MKTSRALLIVCSMVAGCGSDGLPLTNGTGPYAVGDLGGPSSSQPGQPTPGSGNSSNNNPPPTLVTDGGTSIALVDLAKPSPGNPVGAACKTACDCQAGLACVNSQCYSSNLGMLYCCSSSNCPNGSYCQDSAGNYAMCGNNGMGGIGGFGVPDLGLGPIPLPAPVDLGSGTGGSGPGYCQYVPCTGNQICKQVGCGSCNTTDKRCQ